MASMLLSCNGKTLNSHIINELCSYFMSKYATINAVVITKESNKSSEKYKSISKSIEISLFICEMLFL